MKKVIRLTESELTRLIKRVVSEQIAMDPKEPQQDNTKIDTYDFWKSRFDKITNKLDSYFSTIEGPLDVKRFQTLVRNTFYDMVGKVDDEFSMPEHGDEYQQLKNEYFEYFTNKQRDLIKRFGKK